MLGRDGKKSEDNEFWQSQNSSERIPNVSISPINKVSQANNQKLAIAQIDLILKTPRSLLLRKLSNSCFFFREKGRNFYSPAFLPKSPG